MEMLLHGIQTGLGWVLPFVLLISLTVFVHEMGHFLVAKYFGVRVEVFSIGIGKKIWKRKWGDTEYALSLLPLGGYVKMFGDELGAEIDPAQKQFSFVHKPVLQRIAVVLAGPLMNLFFAILLFVLIAMSGEDQKAPVVGDIPDTSAAYAAGLRSGDVILSASNPTESLENIKTWNQLQKLLNKSIGQTVSLKVRHLDQSAEETVKIIPESTPDTGLLSLSKTMGSIPGLTNLTTGPGIGIGKKDSWAYKVGFRTGDLITKVNEKEVKYWRQAQDLIFQSVVPYKVTVARVNAADKYEMVVLDIKDAIPATVASTPGSNFESLGIEKGEFYLARVMPDTPADKAGLKAGDRLWEIQGQKVNGWEIVQNTVKNYTKEDTGLKIKVLREGEEKEFTITPVMTSTTSSQGLREDRFTIGIVPWLTPSIPEMTTVKYGFSLEAMKRGLERTWEVTAMTLISFVKLFNAEISPKNISGIISIGQVASETFKIGLGQFFSMMSVISINLFILNLLPIPVLDGGHMVFYTIELLKGSPLSLKKIELAQRFGIVVLMSLMVFALFNDFSRFFGN